MESSGSFQLLTERSSVRSIDLCWTRTLCLHISPRARWKRGRMARRRETAGRPGRSWWTGWCIWESRADVLLGWSAAGLERRGLIKRGVCPLTSRSFSDIEQRYTAKKDTHTHTPPLSAAWLSYSSGEEGIWECVYFAGVCVCACQSAVFCLTAGCLLLYVSALCRVRSKVRKSDSRLHCIQKDCDVWFMPTVYYLDSGDVFYMSLYRTRQKVAKNLRLLWISTKSNVMSDIQQ